MDGRGGGGRRRGGIRTAEVDVGVVMGGCGLEEEGV